MEINIAYYFFKFVAIGFALTMCVKILKDESYFEMATLALLFTILSEVVCISTK